MDDSIGSRRSLSRTMSDLGQISVSLDAIFFPSFEEVKARGKSRVSIRVPSLPSLTFSPIPFFAPWQSRRLWNRRTPLNSLLLVGTLSGFWRSQVSDLRCFSRRFGYPLLSCDAFRPSLVSFSFSFQTWKTQRERGRLRLEVASWDSI